MLFEQYCTDSGTIDWLSWFKQTVQHRGRGVMIWGSFAAAGLRQLTIMELTMNYTKFQKVLRENMLKICKNTKLEAELQLKE